VIERRSQHGQAAAGSGGIVFGYVQKLDERHQIIPEYRIQQTQCEAEYKRFRAAINQARMVLDSEMLELGSHAHANDLLPILQTHHVMLLDPELLARTQLLIKQELINVEWALKLCLHDFIQAFEHMEDVYLKSRQADIEQVGERIFNALDGSGEAPKQAKSIVVAADFSPADVVNMWRSDVAGFVAMQGGKDSHAMIVARGVGLSGLAGVHELYEQAKDGDLLILNAKDNTWILCPTHDEQKQLASAQAALLEAREALQAYANMPWQSKDGQQLPLLANIELIEEVPIALKNGVEGIGLFRTEFLFMQSDVLPSEEKQTAYYQAIVKVMAGKPVTFRLLDAGADKLARMHSLLSDYDGENPALGLRGVRMLLHKPEILQTQLRAILQCAKYAEISILVPMVISVEEMAAVRHMMQDIKAELGIVQDVKLGCMIEVPAAALIANDLAKVSDFFSIGSNDLVQYGLAVDRSDEHVSHLYDVNHQAIKMMIQMAVDAAANEGIPVTVCGELAANTAWTQTFLDMQISALSMTSLHVLTVRKHLKELQTKA